ncbi:MAG: LUD domain-containing protein [Deltaproteobacteria bacterium]|nr:MAG: LUD domain-containing protein [Deltaproteobacteria bacterium]
MKELKGRIEVKLSDRILYATLRNFAASYKVSRQNAFEGLDFDALRRDVNASKDFSREEVEDLFQQFKENVERYGSHVYRAKDGADANSYILKVCKTHGAKYLVKSKSMTSEEIKLNAALEAEGVKPVETDLGEYILQVSKDHPSHMVMPAIHQTRGQVCDIFTQHFGKDICPDIGDMVELVRHHLRGYYFKADVGVTGANLAVASTGTIGIVTNEGNARLCTTLPPVHIVLLGYEKLVRNFEDAMKVLRVLSKSATGQISSTYVTWIKGRNPSGKSEKGLKETHYVFLDNGRLDYFAHHTLKEALKCIRCGSCANICPAYEMIGGHVFGNIYIGAIGLIYTALFQSEEAAKDILQLCLSCKACSHNCPAGIDLQQLIAELKLLAGDRFGISPLKKTVYSGVMSNPGVFRALMGIGSVVQKPFLDKDANHLKLPFPQKHDFFVPPSVKRPTFTDLAEKRGATTKETETRAFFYPGCAVEYFYPNMGIALVDLLEKAGVRVDIPPISSCCGLPAAFGGDRPSAEKTIQTNLAFMGNPDDYDAYLVLCPSCGVAIIQQFESLLREDQSLRVKARKIASKTKSLSSFLEEKGIKFSGVANKTVTYHTPCHLGRGMKSTAEPYLSELLGKNFIPLTDTDVCCGFAGSYSVDFPGISSGILGKKMEHVRETGADIVVTDCPGCVMQIESGMVKRSLSAQVMHLSDYLASLETLGAMEPAP